MQKTVSQNKAQSQKETLLKIKETMREEVVQEVKNQGLRQRVFSEFYDLADCTGALLGMLQQKGFVEQLSDEDRQKYDILMTRISCCGLRGQILLEESASEEYENVLHNTEPNSRLYN